MKTCKNKYDGLIDVGYKKHLRVHLGDNAFANCRSHVNGIESFWSYAKRRRACFNGIASHTFYLHQESKFRINHRGANLYQTTLKLLRNNLI